MLNIANEMIVALEKKDKETNQLLLSLDNKLKTANEAIATLEIKSTEQLQDHCPDGWIRFHESCYFFADQYGFDYTEARHFCTEHYGSHLVMVESKEEDSLLQDYAHRLFKDPQYATSKFWMGGNDEEVEGVWVWITNHQPMSQGYTHWFPGEPAGNGPIEDCLCLHPPQFMWHDCHCTEHNHPLCEKNETTPEIVG